MNAPGIVSASTWPGPRNDMWDLVCRFQKSTFKEIPMQRHKMLTAGLLLILGIQVNVYTQGKRDGMIE
jgi:hypothetical protein